MHTGFALDLDEQAAPKYPFIILLGQISSQDRHSGRDCRNPGAMDGFKLAIHGAGYPVPVGYDELGY